MSHSKRTYDSNWGEIRQPILGIREFFDFGAWYTDGFHDLELVLEASGFCDDFSFLSFRLGPTSLRLRARPLPSLIASSVVRVPLV